MVQFDLPVYLASKSPRRKKFLSQLNFPFKTIEIHVDEKINNGEKPIKAVKRLAVEKLEVAKQRVRRGIIITADTIVVLNKEIIGKPRDEKDAKNILKKLSGNTHAVYTGFAVHSTKKDLTIVDYQKTLVTFKKLNNEEIDDYIKSGSPMDKAGAYGIQDDFGAVFVKKINGCYYNVVGLPLPKLYLALLRLAD
jgi:septum formation protein